MAFNPTMEVRRKPSVRAISEDRASSFFSDSQNSWVVFNPAESRPNDILSFSTENPLTDTENDADRSDNGDFIASAHERRTLFSGQSATEADDDLINDLEPSLSNRINAWQKSTEHTDISDNVASWDLDEELIGSVLDTSILKRVPAYYGDQYFKNMSRAEYVRYQRSSAILRQSLTRKGYNASDPDLISRLLSLIKWRDLLRTSGSLVDDYVVNTLSRVHLKERSFHDVEFSDTATSSSLVMCGGGTWNDV